MKNLADLERELDADLRHALNAVMPTLEDSLPTAKDDDRGPGLLRELDVPASLGSRSSPANSPVRRRLRLWAIGGAAAAVLVGVVAIATIRSDEQSPSSATEPPVVPSSVLETGATSWDTGIPTFDIDLDTSGSVVTFERGTDDGIAVGMPVVDSSGLVGKVASVTAETSTALLITQPEFFVAARFDDSADLYMVSGTSDGRIVVRGHTALDESAIGRTLLTTGGDSLAPPGIPVGIIDSITDGQGDDRVLATVRPFDTFGNFTNVNVMLYRPTAGIGSFPLDGLDPYKAAATVLLDARIGPTPDEQVDLEVAVAILVRDCLRDGGATPPAVTAAEHQAARDDLDGLYAFQTNAYTTPGLEFRRENGFLRSAALYDANADTPLHLQIEEGSPEEQLMLDGCGTAGDTLRDQPSEVALRSSTFERIGNRWYSLGPADLPEYADVYQSFDECMVAAGYPDHDVAGIDNPFSEYFINPEYTDEERSAVDADADCRILTNLPTTYVNTLGPVLDEYDNLYRTEITAIRAERDISLETARNILSDNGIEPLTS